MVRLQSPCVWRRGVTFMTIKGPMQLEYTMALKVHVPTDVA